MAEDSVEDQWLLAPAQTTASRVPSQSAKNPIVARYGLSENFQPA
jgi:hypothetical protein